MFEVKALAVERTDTVEGGELNLDTEKSNVSTVNAFELSLSRNLEHQLPLWPKTEKQTPFNTNPHLWHK